MADKIEIARDVIRQFEQLSSLRSNFEVHWTEVAERVVPSLKEEFLSRTATQDTKGEERTQWQFDSTAQIALGRFASIMDSLLTPRNQKWHRLKVSNKELAEVREVRLWFDEVTDLFFKFRYSPAANFASQNQMIFQSLGAFGNGVMFIDENQTEAGLRYKACSLGGIYFTENHQGLVDSVIRHFRMTARQIVQKWPDAAPDKIKEKAQDVGGSKGRGKSSEQEFEIIHCVKPREDVNPNRKDSRGMPFVSYYVLIDGQVVLEEGGFSTFPYAVARHKQAPGEVYARSPAMEVLPSIRTLNEQKKTVLKQGHRATDPILLGHDDGLAGRFSLRPGAFNSGAVTKDGRPLVHTLPVGNLAVGKDMMDDERRDINDVFLVTLFQILVDSGRMTATEVLERAREKGLLLAPQFQRQESEYLGPMIEREFDLLIRQGLLPPMPPVLVEAEGEYEIEYESPFSRAQRSEEAAGLFRVFGSAIEWAQATQDPSVLDHFDTDEIIPDLAGIQGLPERWMRSDADVAAIRADRAEQQRIEQAARVAPGAAAVIKAGAVAQEKAPDQLAAAVEEAG